jgi:hypothetical protein
VARPARGAEPGAPRGAPRRYRQGVDDAPAPLLATSVPAALAAVERARHGLLALGMPLCSACMLLPASLEEVRRARPGLVVAIGEFAGPDDWAERERLLWPRGIHVSRSSVPAMALLADGAVMATRPGGGPAEAIDRWLAGHLGPAARPPGPGLTPREEAALDALGAHLGRQRAAKRLRAGEPGA